MNKLNFDFNRSQPLNLTTIYEVDLVQCCLALSFFARLVAYFAISALLVIILFLILKYLADFHTETTEEEAIANEANPLFRSAKTIPCIYGICETDFESGNCSSSSSGVSSNSSEEFYDGNVCNQLR